MNTEQTSNEQLLIDYLHHALDAKTKAELEQRLSVDEALQHDFQLLKATVLEPELHIGMPNKARLYKQDRGALPIHFVRYMRIAAAVLLICSLFLFRDKQNTSKEVAVVTPMQPTTDTPLLQQNMVDTSIDTMPVAKQTILPVSSKVPALKQRQKPVNILPVNQVVHIPEQTTIPIHQPDVQQPEPEWTVDLPKAETNTIIQPDTIPSLTVSPAQPDREVLVSVDEARHPGFFRLLNHALHARKSWRETKNTLRQTEVVVMLGDQKIIQINSY
jgi:hypothetical protein